ncbi:branched-chain amino acid ABC transporter permease [Solicola sp. PLA-1-18]|uniref:branched-chain amino acid ABC transporter permease n=1 Tax=Solicola sp. PLA-1-18 TaxID=3380532 RepID=UPI003B7F3353
MTALAQALVSGVLLGGLLALVALGLSLVLGVMRLVNLVHGEMVVIGSYAAYVLVTQTGLDPLVSLPIVAAVGAVIAWPVQKLLIQPITAHGEDAPLITTFALSIIVQNLFVLWLGGDTRTVDRGYTRSSLDFGPVTVPTIYLISFVISAVVCVGVHLLLTRTSFGRRLRAGSEDPGAAAIIGVRVPRLHATTFALAGAIAGVAGSLAAMTFSFTPTSGANWLLTGFAVVVLGGLGSVKGTAVGGLMLGVAESLGALAFGDGYRLFVGLVVFLVFLALRPNGLYGSVTT